MVILKTSNSSPPWQVFHLVGNNLDPKTLAIASCVCKSWHTSMSSDHLWKPICTTHFPSLSNLRAANPAVPYRRIYALDHTAAARRQRPLPKPRLSLHNLIFAVDVRLGDSLAVTISKLGRELDTDPNGVFRFDIDVGGEDLLVLNVFAELRVVWNVVVEGFGGVFTMMDCEGEGGFLPGAYGWFSEELPLPGCCSGGGTSGMVADLRLGLREVIGGTMVVEKVSVGVLSVVSWRYVCVDDTLRYLHHFLVPSP